MGNDKADNFQEKKMNKILEGIKHFKQINNVRPYSTCFPTSVCMDLTFHSDNNFDDNFDNEVIKTIIKNEEKHKSKLRNTLGKWTSKYAPYQVFGFWEYYISSNIKGLKAKYVSKNIEKYKEILNTRPLVVSTTLTHAGHIVLLIGYDTIKDGFWVLDPFGKAPYKTKEEKDFNEAYFISGYQWLKKHGLDIDEVKS